MANVCTCYMRIDGERKTLDRLVRRIETRDSRLLKLFPWLEKGAAYGMYGGVDRENDTTLRLPFTCKWQPPKDHIERLSKAFGLKIICWYEEPAMIVYGRVSYESGEIIEDVAYDEEAWMEEQYEDFAVCKRNISESPYEEFLDAYTQGFDWEDVGDSRWCVLEKHIVKRIKDEDLPLFINTPWDCEEAEQMYKARFDKSAITETAHGRP